MSDITLYNYFRSSTSYRARIALHYKNIPFEYKPVHLVNKDGEQNSAEYLKLNPAGEVPTLVHAGKVIAQSFAIIEYLDEVYNSPALFPKDAYHRAKVRQFCENINSFIHPLGNLKVQQYLEKKHGYTTEDKNAWVAHWTAKGLTATEKILSEFSGKYCFGDEITAADLFLVPQVFSSERFGVDLKPYSKIRAVNENCLQIDAFKKAHPLRQIDTPEENRIK